MELSVVIIYRVSIESLFRERSAYQTHWGRVTHICVSKLTIIGSDNGLSPGRRQAIIWTNGGILLIRTLGTNFREILGEIHSFAFSKMHLKLSSAKWRLFGLGLNELNILHILGRYVPTEDQHSEVTLVTLSVIETIYQSESFMPYHLLQTGSCPNLRML